jgi:hypothetical protein
MNMPQALTHNQWWYVVWTLLGIVGASGLLAVLSPRLFSWLATRSSVWYESEGLLKKLDRRIEIDSYVLRHCRLFGVLVVAAAAVIAAFCTVLPFRGDRFAWVVVACTVPAGLFAIFSPRLFALLDAYGSTWVHSERVLEKFDQRIDVDSYILRYCRPFGVLCLGVALVLAVVAALAS